MRRGIDVKLENLSKSLRASFASIKEEFEDHLQAINENTEEINSHIDMFVSVDNKIDKLNEKLEAVMIAVDKLSMSNRNIELSTVEQRIFLVFYTAADNLPFSIGDLSRKTHLNELVIRRAINSMKEKAVILNEKLIEGLTYFYLDFNFKQKQVRENLIRLDDNLIRTINETSLTNFF